MTDGGLPKLLRDIELVADEPKLMTWEKALGASPGGLASSRQDYVRRVGYVLQANVADYNRLVAQLQNPTVSFDLDHNDILSEAERLLHNVVTAASTRADQLRNFMTDHFADDAGLTAQYTAKVKEEFAQDPSNVFLRNLRNYITHRRLPVAQSQETFTQTTYAFTFTLVRDALLEWSGWTADPRKWLEGLDGDVMIVEVVDRYARTAGTFDKWLFDEIGTKFADDLREYHEAATYVDAEWKRHFDF
ncbi:hypothetical protein [Dactylosporangium matsuzakiense]|uniref:hypothetical protein n=1 Tax=Dactylosporangium matsuzakiense TaxID=53360 RepID=UPI0021C40197|nr:hypothetical protein [Dactylosporangium matsuzakiense]UWZ46134.1 hypothetical protein Dmats_06685 [Dactylosporangium matsuzakiense]